MSDDLDAPELGMQALFTKALLLFYTSLFAFTGKAEASPFESGASLKLDEDFVARLRTLKRKPQLVLKLNAANPLASKAMMHTSHSSHRSHSSHSSHYSSSSSGHSSHSSHSSHYSSASYTTPSSSSSSYSTPSVRSYTPATSSFKIKMKTKKASGSRARSTRVPSYTTPTYYSENGEVLLPVYDLGARVLKLGDRGTDVQAMQKLLMALGYQLTADGNFGLTTNAAVKAFQKEQGLTADGVAGPQTLTLLQLP
ncbi:peptidoglycan-binding domain-containing protein [Hymenobacter sp. GOD-10R]|uniref:peptidoglycan-binding domain-containing protein n=1 Tax=Hymenobacter sp. GOD-10R TaxID=3093922 RepID=UPI002D7A0069|nr:peptidoglycan-binding domain-containing protein [Hymenobacter sp. GOD-10R]WRQ31828.1 peptidoglycan-binding domain-containing protein [Hymenobacter sp. GOD-10R]